MRSALLRTLGAGATLTHEGRCYNVIFDNEYQLALSGEVEGRAPAALMATSDVSCAKLQKEVIVEVYNPFESITKSYRVRTLEPDGTGMTLVVLKAA